MTTCLISRRRPGLGGSCASARRTLGGISTEAAAAAAVPTAASKNLRLVLGATAVSGEPVGFIMDILVEKIVYRVSGRASHPARVPSAHPPHNEVTSRSLRGAFSNEGMLES